MPSPKQLNGLLRVFAFSRVRAWRSFLLVLALFLTPGLLHAATLSNDICTGAMVIPGNEPFPFLTPLIPDIRPATTNGDPVPSCDSYVSHGIWFTFTPASSQLYRFALNPAETLTTVPYTVMALYSSTGPCNGLQELACSDDDGCAFMAEILADLTALRTYYICVWQFGTLPLSDDQAAIQLHVSTPVSGTTPPPNDVCENAQSVPRAGPFPHLTAPVDISVASSTGDPAPPCQPSINTSWGIWYQFRPTSNAVYNFSTCYDTATTVCDTLMAIYASYGNCSFIPPNPIPIACQDDTCPPEYRAAITTALSASSNYFIVVWGKQDDPPAVGHTTVQLRISQLEPKFFSAAKSSGGSFEGKFFGIVGSNYTIQASTNLRTWQTIGQLTGHRKGANLFLDTAAGPISNRNYRVTTP